MDIHITYTCFKKDDNILSKESIHFIVFIVTENNIFVLYSTIDQHSETYTWIIYSKVII